MYKHPRKVAVCRGKVLVYGSLRRLGCVCRRVWKGTFHFEMNPSVSCRTYFVADMKWGDVFIHNPRCWWCKIVLAWLGRPHGRILGQVTIDALTASRTTPASAAWLSSRCRFRVHQNLMPSKYRGLKRYLGDPKGTSQHLRFLKSWTWQRVPVRRVTETSIIWAWPSSFWRLPLSWPDPRSIQWTPVPIKEWPARGHPHNGFELKVSR